MFIRAVFWIGLVSLLMPREPQFTDCAKSEALCAASDIFGALQDSFLRSLAQVKAEIQAQQNARAARGR